MLTITNLDTGERVTCDHPEDIPALITPWYPDAPEEVNNAIEAMRDWWDNTSVEMAQTADHLRITVESTPDDDLEPLDSMPSLRTLSTILPLEDYQLLSRVGVDRALRLSGEMPHGTTLTRIAFIKRAAGIEKAREAWELDRKGLAAAFREAHTVAHAKWEAERAEIYAGGRLTGPALDIMREAMGVSQRELAHDLKVNPDTIRAWKAGKKSYALPSAGISAEMRGALAATIVNANLLIDHAAERGTAECPIFTKADDPALVRIAAILLASQGRRFNIDTTLCRHDDDEKTCPRCYLGW